MKTTRMNVEFSSACIDMNDEHQVYLRYSLERIWDRSLPMVMFVGLNPSTANASEDDPTIRRVRNFAKSWGFGGICMVNVFPMITPDPSKLKLINIAKNDEEIKRVSSNCAEVVFCWGNFKEPVQTGRVGMFKKWFPEAKCLGKNANGSPKHPLYLRADTQLIQF
jgi:hypothetical protein